jgi:hypothetical protein
MSDAVKRYCFILKIFNEGAFKFEIEIVLQKNVQGLNNDPFMG